MSAGFKLIAFRSSIAHQPANDAKVQTKLTTLEPKGDIKTIGLNADETLLGVLASTSQGCFVFVYDVLTLSVDVPGKAVPLSMIRIGQSASKGVAFEWNPALADIFAASDDDRTLSVAKIDLQNSSKYSVVGEKKLEAIVNEISWSPKGKQLVVGDMRGKIYQLKPELELVRTTNPPENAGNVAVMNLSWLSTTDWLVAYSNPEMTNSATFMLSIKKDKPPSWTPMNWPTQSSLGITRRLLVDWNVALVVLPCSTDLILVSKPASATAWSSGSVASLQRPSPNVFVVGVAVDLSNEAAVVIGDGTSRRVPVVNILNSDGSVLSYQLSPPSKDYPDCSVSPSPIDISKITNGLRPSSPAATTQPAPPQAPTPATTAQPTSLFGGFTPKTAVANPQPTSLFGAPQISLTKSGVSAVPVSQKATPAEGQTVAASKESEEAAISLQKESAKKAIEAFATEWHEFHRDLHAFAINLKKATGFIEENVDSLTHTDNVETLEEIQKMVVELEDEMNDMQDMLAERKATVEERMALAKEYKDSQIIFGRDPLERAQSEQVLQRYEDFTLKLHEAKKLIAETKNIPSSYKPRQISEFDPKFGGRIQESLKKLSRFSEAVKSRVDDLERKTAYLKSLRNADALNESLEESSKSFKEAPCSVFAYVHSKPAKLDRNEPEGCHEKARGFDLRVLDKRRYSELVITSPTKARSVPSIRNMGTQADMPASTLTVKSSEAQPSSLAPSSTLTFGASKPAEEKKLFGTGIVPVSTSTPIIGSKFGMVPQKAGSSLFSSALSEKQPQNAEADGLGSKSTQAPIVSQSGGGLFGSSSLFKGIRNAELDGNVGEKALNVTGTKEPTAEEGKQKEEKQNFTFGVTESSTAKESTTLTFGNICSPNVAKKEEKPTSIFGGQGAISIGKKEEKPSSIFGGLGTSTVKDGEKKDEKQSSLFKEESNSEKKEEKTTSLFGGISSTPTTEKKEEKPTSIFGNLSTTPQKPVEVVETNSTSVEKPPESTPTSGGKIDGNTLIGAVGQDATKTDQTTASQPASNSQPFGSIFGSKPAVTAAGDATSTSPSVTFSFKPKPVETAPAASVSSAFNFASKPAAAAPSTGTSSAFNFSKPAGSSTLGFAAAAASAAASAEGDEGMDDDGAPGSVSQSGGNIFGGGFLSGFGSATSANANKNVFGGTSSLLKNAAAKPETSSIFSKPAGQSSVFGAAPKFGGPPVFGAKPAFGAPTAQSTTAFGGGAAPSGGGFSAFSGNKSLFGGVSSGGGSSLFGGGMSNQNQPKTSSLFGGGQQASSFSTWR
ncbi:unnamed protein product [Nippostrongylus brasiliensis]|uniref:Nuclear pore complex protein Nup214 (inferred by orthology to a human protein) n=1 Tax=Nippostrongylus brasiliensis TaxID=27835 RepID=A0A0N4Y7V1_NIPBR|nr:unnamed protein product [Nippostrongylus brasiliensis]